MPHMGYLDDMRFNHLEDLAVYLNSQSEELKAAEFVVNILGKPKWCFLNSRGTLIDLMYNGDRAVTICDSWNGIMIEITNGNDQFFHCDTKISPKELKRIFDSLAYNG